MIAPDLVVKQHVDAWLAQIRARPGHIDDIFAELTEATRAEIKTYMASAEIQTRLGWTMHAPTMPIIAITNKAEQESMQLIGSHPGDQEIGGQWLPAHRVDGAVYYEAMTTQFSGGVDVAIYALNPTETVWLVAIVKWALLVARKTMEEIGLVEQTLSVTDFMPAPDYPQPDPAYTRVVSMRYTTFVDATLEDHDGASLIDPSDVLVINTEDPSSE